MKILSSRKQEPKGKEISELLTRLLDCTRYDGRLRPNYGGEILTYKLSVKIYHRRREGVESEETHAFHGERSGNQSSSTEYKG